ncbi:conserved Plasmodium protein, unknown function [Plasmodium malariae]|uniref:Uncharacterized protein n=1 Tax=Plasmodium malariae TaxID=5858 RepID=A0A1C3KE84_PLAMA|nr:conserved Plasmodium protein, unknown function [Plasmodium malariae]
MHLKTHFFSRNNVKIFDNYFVNKLFYSPSLAFFKNVKYLNKLNNVNHIFSPKKCNTHLIEKKYASQQVIIDTIRKAKNKLDRGSLYLLQEVNI